MDEPTVIVDARNVLRSRWPNLAEDWFLERVRAWAAREGVRALVVFDGRAPDPEPDERLTVVGTGRSADDWIAERAPALTAEGGRRLWLVTSDRELRRRVEPHAERTIGGGAFAAILESELGPRERA